MKGREVLHSSKSDDWSTPQYFYNWLNDTYHFTLDPCASDENHKCDKYYTIETDGLKQSWENETVFINPPYSNCYGWVEKAFNESWQHCAKCVILLPARVDTRYWHEFIMLGSNNIGFIKGRLKFGDSKNAAPFPSCIVEFNPVVIPIRILKSSILSTETYSINLDSIKERYDNKNR